MAYKIIFYFLFLPTAQAQDTHLQNLVQHPDLDPLLNQSSSVLLYELDEQFLFISSDSELVIQWNDSGDGLLFRHRNTNDTHLLKQLKNSHKGSWICTVAGAGKKPKCFKRS